MKLKYYLRGLGIGMIVTALILGISFSHRQGQETQTLTDDQIRERAEQLGMVDSSELTLAALQNSVQQQAQENTEKTEASPAPETEEAMTTTSEPETTVAPERIPWNRRQRLHRKIPWNRKQHHSLRRL